MSLSRKILAVEDSSSLRALISQTLRGGGYEVVEAADGEEALEMLSRDTVDLLISDVNMPRLGGIELTQKVRSMPGMRFLPIILITSDGSDESKRASSKQAGASGWISKPFQPEKLLNVTRMILGHA